MKNMKTRKSLSLMAAAFGLAWLLIGTGCSKQSEPAPAPPAQPAKKDAVKVRLKWLHQAQFAGFYTAKEKGFYSAKRLDVSLEPGGMDFPAVQMVSSGSEDFGVTGADQILLAREKGVPIVAVAVVYRKSPFCYFALKSSGITKPHDFVGKSIGVKLGGNEELTYRAMMRKAGVDMKAVNETPVKFDMTPLFTGQVLAWPGYSINEPILAQEKGFELSYIWPADYGVNLYADTLFTTEAMIRDKPDLVERFVAATIEGWDYAVAHQDEAVRFTLKQSDKLKTDHEAAMMKASVPHLKPDEKPIGSMEKAKWEEIQALLLDAGFTKKPVNIDSAFTTRFLPQLK
jgi:ABC-type nitrate/sulfonate/bicarbonate transport system substrate-binding protein